MPDAVTTTRFDYITQHGNRPPLSVAGVKSYAHPTDSKITCADGFTLSVIAGDGTYCTPRPSNYGLGQVPADYPGPYTAVEVGYPSERPEPWDEWSRHIEAWDDDQDPTDAVYPYVPVEMVSALIELHGGESADELDPQGRRVEQAADSWFAPAIPVSAPTGEVRVRRARPDGPTTSS